IGKIEILVLENAERTNNSDNITEDEILENMNEQLLTIPFCDWSQVLMFKGSFKIDLLKYPDPKAVVLSGFWVDGLLVENFSNARELFVAYQQTEDFSMKGFCKLLSEAFCKWSSACKS
ncbi:putative glycosyltransferase, partial [Trichinella spiralis]|uniref:putative glycosyltransferase n=1 Tax=Trichinella spiralis TaxID=6334 RepID=UPI0001EFD485